MEGTSRIQHLPQRLSGTRIKRCGNKILLSVLCSYTSFVCIITASTDPKQRRYWIKHTHKKYKDRSTVQYRWSIKIKSLADLKDSSSINHEEEKIVTKFKWTLNKSWVFVCVAEATRILPRRDENVRHSYRSSHRKAVVWNREQEKRKRRKESINTSNVKQKFSNVKLIDYNLSSFLMECLHSQK